MEHPGQNDIATPLRLAGNFVGYPGHGIGRPDHLVLAHRLHRRVSGYGETVRPCDARAFGRIDPRQATCDRNLQVEVLALNKLPIADIFPAAGNYPVGNGKTGDGNTELRRGQRQQRLVGVGGDFAHVGHSREKTSGITAVRRLVRVAQDERDRFWPDVQFLGNRLRIIAAHPRTCFGSARARENRIVAADLEPRREESRVKLVCVERSLLFGCAGGESRRDGERDKKSATRLDEGAPRERDRKIGCVRRIDGRLRFQSHQIHGHGVHSLQAFMALAARCTASMIAA